MLAKPRQHNQVQSHHGDGGLIVFLRADDSSPWLVVSFSCAMRQLWNLSFGSWNTEVWVKTYRRHLNTSIEV